MSRRRIVCALFVSCASVVLTGCMPKMTMDDMKAAMPQRPPELNALNAFAGKWTSEGEARMSGVDQVMKSTGTMDAKWDGDGWFLVNRGVFTMGDFGKMTGIETWTYDTHSKRYRSTWVDSMGSIGTGESWHNKDDNTWKMRFKSHGPHGTTTGKGTVKIIDDNTMEWTWSEYAMGGLMKTMEMKGTSRRQ